MRAIFGLVSLLVVVAIIAYLFSIYDIPVAKKGQQVQKQAQQLSGHDEDGTPADRTVTLDADITNNKLRDLIVTKVVPGGAMDRFYGFKIGDKIVSIGDMDVGAISNDDFETAKAMLLQEGYEKQKPVIVMRNGERMQLPDLSNAPPPLSNGGGGAQPASSGSSPSRQSLIDQLKSATPDK